MSWACSACTFVNENPSGLVCDVCGTQRLQVPPSQDHATRNVATGETTEMEMETDRSRMLKVIRMYEENVRSHPGVSKYRKLKLTNETMATVWCVKVKYTIATTPTL